MGSFNNGGKSNSLCYYDPRTKKIRRLTGTADAKTFKATDISQIETDDQHHVWIGTWDMGLYHYYRQRSWYHNKINSPIILKHLLSRRRIQSKYCELYQAGKKWENLVRHHQWRIKCLDTKSNTIQWFTIKDGYAQQPYLSH